jgi:hypothetical protein
MIYCTQGEHVYTNVIKYNTQGEHVYTNVIKYNIIIGV